ncbi:hypothetical protein HG531_010301 [Fusarium graminearum]|nr:hypothetical protein HG531_010301 [Fusarium graminearum]
MLGCDDAKLRFCSKVLSNLLAERQEILLKGQVSAAIDLDVLDIAEEIVSHACMGVDLAVIVAVKQFADCLLTVKVLDVVLEKFQVVDSPLLLPHLLKGVGEIECANLLSILKLEKLISTVARHVHQNVASIIGKEALTSRHLGANAISQEANKVLDSDLIATVVHLNVVTVEINGAIGVAVDGSREGIAGIASHVIGKHEDDLGVGNTETLNGSVHGEDIGEVAVVEPEPRCADQNSPVAGMFGESGCCKQSRCHKGVEPKVGELHGGDAMRCNAIKVNG